MVILATIPAMSAEQDQAIRDTVLGERARLLRFIRRYVTDREEVDDILQEVFYELVGAYRLMQPIEQAGAWLLRVARNRIIDRFRRRRPVQLQSEVTDSEGETLPWEELLPSAEAGPDAQFARQILMEQIQAAIEQLPDAQRQIFIAHELEGRSFKELALETGVSVNTLLSRKHAAVSSLRQRLQTVYEEFETMTGDFK